VGRGPDERRESVVMAEEPGEGSKKGQVKGAKKERLGQPNE